MVPLIAVRSLVAAVALHAILFANCQTLGEPEVAGCRSCSEGLSDVVAGSALLQSKQGVRRRPLSGEETDGGFTSFVAIVQQALERRLRSGQPCDLCEKDWVIILATGRSGSTSVLQMLNALPGWFIAGEHAGAFQGLFDFWRTIFIGNVSARFGGRNVANLTNYKNHTESINAWFHVEPSEESVLCALQDAAQALLGGINSSEFATVGFKEIRYSQPDMLKFLAKLFPCASFVVNVRRDSNAQASSAFWKHRRQATQQINRATHALREWQAQQNSSRFLLELEDFSAEMFNNMLAWLNVTGCHFTQVAHANDNGTYNSTTAKAELAGNCTIRRRTM